MLVVRMYRRLQSEIMVYQWRFQTLNFFKWGGGSKSKLCVSPFTQHLRILINDYTRYGYHIYKNNKHNRECSERKGNHPRIQFCLFTFRPVASKQINILTTIAPLSWLGAAEVTHRLLMREVKAQLREGFFVWFVSFVIVVFLLFVQKHIFRHIFLQFLLQC